MNPEQIVRGHLSGLIFGIVIALILYGSTLPGAAKRQEEQRIARAKGMAYPMATKRLESFGYTVLLSRHVQIPIEDEYAWYVCESTQVAKYAVELELGYKGRCDSK